MAGTFDRSLDGFGYNVTRGGRDLALGVIRKLRPHRAVGYEKLRVGRPYDGGYVMLADFEGVDAAYSLGVCEDVSWDLDIAARGIDIHQYDHTISALPQVHKRFHWHPLGIAGQADAARSMATLEGIMAANGHLERGDLILKCDIEGHEWEVLATTDIAVLKRFRQIVIELHALRDLHDPTFADLARRAVDNLTANHRVVHVHGNNYSFYTIVGGIPIPSVMEFTLVRTDGKSFTDCDETFPTALDMPCLPDNPDHALGAFRF